MTVTDIYEAMNSRAEAFFEWTQAHPGYGLLFAAALLALWLTGLLLRWKWACQIVLVGMALIACLTMMFFVLM